MALPFIFADNARSTLGAPLGLSSSTITLSSGGGSLFPNPASGQQFALTINDLATQTVFETVWCTARAGDVLTVLRGQEGTVARAWTSGDYIWNGPTAGQMQNMVQTPHMIDASIAPVFSSTQVQGSFSATGAASFNSTGSFGSTVTAVDVSTGNSSGMVVQSTASGTQGARIKLVGSPGTTGTPNKWLRAQGGVFDIVNNGYSAPIFTLTDLGDVTSIRNLTASGAGTFGGAVSSGSFGSFTDSGTTHGLSVIGSGGSGANLVLFTNAGNKFIRSLSNRLEVVNSAYTQAIFSIDDAGNFSATGNGTVSGGLGAQTVAATGAISGLSLAANNGNVVANNGRLRASLGARSSGDPNAATILGDFVLNPATTGYYILPDNTIIQWGSSTLNGDPAFAVFFPIVFPTACLSVVCTEGAAHDGWGIGTGNNPTPTIHAVSGFNNNAWFHAGAIWSESLGKVWILGNLSCNWMAIGH